MICCIRVRIYPWTNIYFNSIFVYLTECVQSVHLICASI